MQSKRQVFDVCVVGSGPGGGIATYILARAGLKVALVEAGRRLRAGIDYNAHLPAYDNLDQRLKAGYQSPVSSVFSDYGERNHFIPVGDNPGHGLLKALGGRSLCWAGHSLRFGPLDFKRWPISYEEVAPYYSRAEALMCVHGEKNGLANLPDGDFHKAVPMRCAERLLQHGVDRLRKQGRDMYLVPQRKAMPTEASRSNRAVCHYCGHCMRGCEVDAKYTSVNTPIRLALETGNLTVITEAMMTRIVMDDEGRQVAGIEYSAAAGGKERIDCRSLVLACSTVETARQLLINKTARFPTGLANSSGQVGKNLTSHFGVGGMVVYFPALRNRDASNDDGTDFYHSLLTGLYWEKANPNFDGTYQVQCGSGLDPYRMISSSLVPGFGSSLKREFKEKNICHAVMDMQGSLQISPRKFVDLDPERTDKFGLPLPRVHLHYEANDVAMAQDAVTTCREIMEAAGGRILSAPSTITPSKLVIDYNHWVGTARMGTKPDQSVVNLHCQSHDVPNLFIGDASVFPAYPEKNPTLTNIALSWRMGDHLVEKFRRGEI